MRKATKKLRRFLSFILGYGIFQTLRLTLKIKVINPECWDEAQKSHPSSSFIIAVWHEHLMASVIAHCNRKIGMLVGKTYLGDTIAAVVHRLGYRTFRGSSAHGGKAALSSFRQEYSKGWRIAITVEGSRGPRHQVKPGSIALASQTGIPLLPMICKSDSYWTLGTWDKFKIPRPFSHIYVLYARPYHVKENLTSESFTSEQDNLRKVLLGLEKEWENAVQGEPSYGNHFSSKPM